MSFDNGASPQAVPTTLLVLIRILIKTWDLAAIKLSHYKMPQAFSYIKGLWIRK